MQNMILGMIAGVLLTLTIQRVIAFAGVYMPWQRALMSGAPVSMLAIICMRLRGSPVDFLLEAHRTLIHTDRPADLNLIESCYVSNRHKFIEDDMEKFLELVELHRKVYDDAA